MDCVMTTECTYINNIYIHCCGTNHCILLKIHLQPHEILRRIELPYDYAILHTCMRHNSVHMLNNR